jgi:hypothetical protein
MQQPETKSQQCDSVTHYSMPKSAYDFGRPSAASSTSSVTRDCIATQARHIRHHIKRRATSSRAEQSRAEQSRAEQSRAEQSRAEQSRAEQSTVTATRTHLRDIAIGLHVSCELRRRRPEHDGTLRTNGDDASLVRRYLHHLNCSAVADACTAQRTAAQITRQRSRQGSGVARASESEPTNDEVVDARTHQQT